MPDPAAALTLAVVIPKSAFITWGVMLFLVGLACWLKHGLTPGPPRLLQNVFEFFMEQLCSLIREIVRADPEPYVPLAGTLFLFVFTANLVGMIPGLSSPTSDLSVASGLSVIVFLSVPFYGLHMRGWRSYGKTYLEPNPFMLPFNILGEITRTLSLAVRLFGNIMSGEFLMLVVVSVVTTVLQGYARVFIPFTFALTLFLSVLSLITAGIQAYIFTVLALVYIGAAVERRNKSAHTAAPPPAGTHAEGDS